MVLIDSDIESMGEQQQCEQESSQREMEVIIDISDEVLEVHGLAPG